MIALPEMKSQLEEMKKYNWKNSFYRKFFYAWKTGTFLNAIKKLREELETSLNAFLRSYFLDLFFEAAILLLYDGGLCDSLENKDDYYKEQFAFNKRRWRSGKYK